MAVFFDELRQQGFNEGDNLAVDRRGTDIRNEQFGAMAAALVTDAIICAGEAAAGAAQAATTTIPIIVTGDDLVGAKLVRSLAHPGGNTTGVTILAAEARWEAAGNPY
jgi:putative tryptophan/tyrosine transport system substrate-binding protein